MRFLIQGLIILAMLTTQSYGEQALPSQQTVSKEAEKSLWDKIVTALFPESDSEKSADEILTEKILEKAPKKTAAKAPKKGSERPLPEISMGRKDAPVVMINYSSLSCGHCAHFHGDILPKVETKYIEPGYLRIVFRDFPGDQVSLRAHQLAWCKGEMKYLDFMKLLYANQEKWLFADDPVAALKTIALQNGIPPKQFEACLKNQELLDQIVALRLDGQKKYNIAATPTIIINAKIYQKALSLEELDEIMKPLIVTYAEK